MAGTPSVVAVRHFEKIAGVDRQHCGFFDMRRVQSICQPRKLRVVWLYCTHITVVRLTCLRFFLDLVEVKFQAEPIDDTACLLPRCALDTAVLPNRVQAVLVWYPGIVCGCCAQGCFKVLVHRIIRAGPAAKFKDGGARFVHCDTVDFSAFLHAEHDCQFFLIP